MIINKLMEGGFPIRALGLLEEIHRIIIIINQFSNVLTHIRYSKLEKLSTLPPCPPEVFPSTAVNVFIFLLETCFM